MKTHRAKMNKRDDVNAISYVLCQCGWATGIVNGSTTAQEQFDKHKARAAAAAKRKG